MKIVLVVQEKLPVVGYGGTGRQVEWLATELVRRGHRVTIIAPAGSSHRACEVRGARSEADVPELVPDDADIVHRHGWNGVPLPFRTLNTAHGNSGGPMRSPDNWSFVSRSHAANHGCSTYVYNGFPVDDYRLGRKTGRLLFLAGFARPSKGMARAIRLAERFDFPLDLAGGRRIDLLARSANRRDLLFLKTLSSRFRLHGVVDGRTKIDLLGSARAFLNPIAWEEPFGMAPVEAMLCGTPVLATPCGAMPEIVSNETGRLFETDAEFGEALAAIDDFRPEIVRQYAADSFPIAATAAGYLRLYERILDGETIG